MSTELLETCTGFK